MRPYRLLPACAGLLLSLCLGLTGPAQAETVLRCADSKGRPIFTDDPRRCGNQLTETVEVQLHNRHDQFGQTESKEYYNYANRAHTELSGYSIRIIAETELLVTNPQLTHATARRLQQKVQQALALMPNEHHRLFAGIRYYLFNGTDSSYGGKDGGLWYFRTGNGISPRFDDSIIINSAQRYRDASEEQALWVVVHELAHGFNYYQRARLWQAQKAAYQNAIDKKLYQKPGKSPADKPWKAYALTNEREYFAELSAMFFARHYYPPYNRQGLAAYDPQGYALMTTAWLEMAVLVSPSR